MSSTRRRYEALAAAPVVVLFAAVYAWAVPTSGPNRWVDAFWIAVLFTIPVALWLVMSGLLVQRWWAEAGARVSTMDGPGQVLAVAVATLPEPRRRWGQAMLGELAQVERRPARWRFALSCARAALFLPSPTRRPVLAVAAAAVVAAVAAAYPAVDSALPGFGFFATAFVAVAGAAVLLALARGRRVRLPVPAATVLVTAAVAASVAATAVLLHRHPAAAAGLSPAKAVVLAAVLAGCLWLAVAPPRALGGSRLAPHLGAGVAVVSTLGLLAAVRAGGELTAVLLLFGPALTFGIAAAGAAAGARSFRAGMQAGVWSAITFTPVTFAVGLAESLRRYSATDAWTFAGDGTTAGFTLSFAFVTLMTTLVGGFPFAVFGATAGALVRGAHGSRPAG